MGYGSKIWDRVVSQTLLVIFFLFIHVFLVLQFYRQYREKWLVFGTQPRYKVTGDLWVKLDDSQRLTISVKLFLKNLSRFIGIIKARNDENLADLITISLKHAVLNNMQVLLTDLYDKKVHSEKLTLLVIYNVYILQSDW